MVGHRLARQTPPAATTAELWLHIERACIQIPQTHISSLIRFIPDSVAVIIAAHGSDTKY